jgi:hypothetical protein
LHAAAVIFADQKTHTQFNGGPIKIYKYNIRAPERNIAQHTQKSSFKLEKRILKPA